MIIDMTLPEDHLKYNCPSCNEKLIKFSKGKYFFCKHENKHFTLEEIKLNELDKIRVGKNHRICLNCDEKDCNYKHDSEKCDKLESKEKIRGLERWF